MQRAGSCDAAREHAPPQHGSTQHAPRSTHRARCMLWRGCWCGGRVVPRGHSRLALCAATASAARHRRRHQATPPSTTLAPPPPLAADAAAAAAAATAAATTAGASAGTDSQRERESARERERETDRQRERARESEIGCCRVTELWTLLSGFMYSSECSLGAFHLYHAQPDWQP